MKKISSKSIGNVGMSMAIIVLVCLVIGGCYFYFESRSTSNSTTSTDNSTFKEEYESLNKKENYIDLEIPSDNIIKYASISEVIDMIKSKTGVIYFGFPECPWCRNIVPVLLESGKEAGLEEIYYLNARNERDQKHLDENGNIVVDNEGTKEYQELVTLLYDFLTPYEGLNDESIKRLYFPTVIFVKDGRILDIHIGSLDSQEDPSIVLTESQKEELKSIYIEKMKKTLVCDDLC